MTINPPLFVLVEGDSRDGAALAAQAKAHGMTVTVLTDASGATDVDSRSCDTTDPACIVRCVLGLMSRHTVAALLPGQERTLVAAVAAARALGLDGPDPAAVWDTHQKPRARALSNGLAANPVPFWLLEHRDDVASVPASHYPVVAKPPAARGGVGVMACSSPSELKNYVAEWLGAPDHRGKPIAGPLLAEKFVSGPEYAVELFHGIPVAMGRKTVGGPTGFVELASELAGWHRWEERLLLAPFVERLVQRLGLDWGPVHIEVRIENGVPRLIEASWGLPGGMIPELIKLATGIDYYRCLADAACGIDVKPEPVQDRCAAVRFVTTPVSGRIAGHDLAGALALDGVADAAVYRQRGEFVPTTTHAGLRLGHVLATGSTTGQAAATATAGVKRLDLRVA